VHWFKLETKNEAQGRKFGLSGVRRFLKRAAAWSGGGSRHAAEVGEGPDAALGIGSWLAGARDRWSQAGCGSGTSHGRVPIRIGEVGG
jgi:hypothetical protein